MKGVEYVHYGSTNFDPERLRVIRECAPPNKPNRGFWASPNDEERFYTWKQWATAEDFAECDNACCITFTLKKDAKIIAIDSPQAFKKYVDDGVLELEDPYGCGIKWLKYPEKTYEEYDGIELIHGPYYGYFHLMFTPIEKLGIIALDKLV